jgi:hypothetical protein
VQSSSIILDSDLFRDVQNKPRPDSSDSGQACSLQHMLELVKACHFCWSGATQRLLSPTLVRRSWETTNDERFCNPESVAC